MTNRTTRAEPACHSADVETGTGSPVAAGGSPALPQTTEAKLRKWLTIARPAWSYPLEKDEASALVAEIDKARAAWQPIETAPAQKVLLLFAITFEENGVVKNWKMATGCKDHEGAWEWGGHRLHAWDHFPTHWMHLPEPPL